VASGYASKGKRSLARFPELSEKERRGKDSKGKKARSQEKGGKRGSLCTPVEERGQRVLAYRKGKEWKRGTFKGGKGYFRDGGPKEKAISTREMPVTRFWQAHKGRVHNVNQRKKTKGPDPDSA